jgi:hypothetical protein
MTLEFWNGYREKLQSPLAWLWGTRAAKGLGFRAGLNAASRLVIAQYALNTPKATERIATPLTRKTAKSAST